MGNFKIEKSPEAEPQYCDYIQEKVDIARDNGAVYELADEDNRIQLLYNQEELVTKDKIKVINRVRSNDDGKEYIVVNKNVDFFTPDPENPKKAGVYKDRYSTREGIVELPVKSINPETGATETKQTRLVYTIPFSAGKVDEYLKKSEDQGGIPQLTFYNGAVTSDRLPSVLPTVANSDYFKDATWQELLIGKEKKVTDSLVNRLPEVRKEIKDKEQPSEKPKPSEPKKEEEVNNKQQEPLLKQSIIEEKGGKFQPEFKSNRFNTNNK